MKYRLNGISVPFGGISWDKDVSEKDRIKHLFFYLESKRILTNPIEMEIASQCVEAVLEIKNMLISITQDVAFSNENIELLRQMINACNKYLDDLNKLELPHIIYKEDDRWADMNFDRAMKSFRQAFKSAITELEHKNNLIFHVAISEKW